MARLGVLLLSTVPLSTALLRYEKSHLSVALSMEAVELCDKGSPVRSLDDIILDVLAVARHAKSLA
jgi:hypothetical protein